MSKLVELESGQLRSFRQLAVIGDLHSDYFSLKYALKLVDPSKDGIIFLGDYADRGYFGIKVIDDVDRLVQKHPGNVFALKGNHEDYSDLGEPNFGYCRQSLVEEAELKRGSWDKYFAETFTPFVKRLNLAVLVPGEALFVHGGVSSRIRGLEDLRKPSREVEEDLLWSDPFEVVGEQMNPRGIGVAFGPDISKKVCNGLGIKRIIRSHEPHKAALAGAACTSHNGRVLTTSTTTSGPGYQPYLLVIDPTDFRMRCLQIYDEPPVEKQVAKCNAYL